MASMTIFSIFSDRDRYPDRDVEIALSRDSAQILKEYVDRGYRLASINSLVLLAVSRGEFFSEEMTKVPNSINLSVLEKINRVCGFRSNKRTLSEGIQVPFQSKTEERITGEGRGSRLCSPRYFYEHWFQMQSEW